MSISNPEILSRLVQQGKQELARLGGRLVLVADAPKPLYVLELPRSASIHRAGNALRDFCWGAIPGADDSMSRCVELGRLTAVLATGCDVMPTNSCMWMGDSIDKALEYGGPEKVLMLFRSSELRNSGLDARFTDSSSHLAERRTDYPTETRSRDGTLWLSRLPQNDPRIGSPDEVAYCRWIPGDPWQVLLAIFVIGPDGGRLLAHCVGATRNCRCVDQP